MPGARRRGRPRKAWMDNINTWTGLSVEESIGMTEDREINGESVSMVWPNHIIIIISIITNLLWRHLTGDQQRLTYIEAYGKKINSIKKQKIDKRT